MSDKHYEVINGGNYYFVRAQKLHSQIMQCKKEENLCVNLCNICYDAAKLYVNMLDSWCTLKYKHTLPLLILDLQDKGVNIGAKAFEHACILYAAYSADHNTVSANMLHKVLASYMEMRTAILEWSQDNCSPEYDSDKHLYTHKITGVCLKVGVVSASYSLDQFYELC